MKNILASNKDSNLSRYSNAKDIQKCNRKYSKKDIFWCDNRGNLTDIFFKWNFK